MTLQEFVSSAPSIVVCKIYNQCTLEILMDTQFRKAAAYKNASGALICRSYGATWEEVYKKLVSNLQERSALITVRI
jgi:hypothetical protein